MSEAQAVYETQYNALSEKFYKEELWPRAETVAPLVKNDVRD